ncbi:MAG: 50S ribosomal protein L27 [Candidatus Shapirobacteria bacterium]
MAHTKSQGKTNQKSNRPGQRLGIKKSGGQKVTVGQIIARQVGSKYHSGLGTKLGKDFTIYAIRPGVVKFIDKLGKKVITVVRPFIKTVKKEIIAVETKVVAKIKKPVAKLSKAKSALGEKVTVKKVVKK